MAFKTFLAGDVLTASEVNTYLMKQAVIVCTSGTRPGSPVEGMTIYETDTDKVLFYDGATWNLPKNVAGGVLGYAQAVSDQTGITTETDLTTLSVTVTVGASRRIRVSSQLSPYSTVAGDSVWGRIKEGATTLQFSQATMNGAQAESTTITAIVSPSAGAHTYKVSLTRQGGTGSVTSQASSTAPAFICVEDVGGV